MHGREIVISLGSLESHWMVESDGTMEMNSSLSSSLNQVGRAGAWPLLDREI